MKMSPTLKEISIKKYNDDGQWVYGSDDVSFWIMGNHKYALYCWMAAEEAGKKIRETTLVHVDKHFDYTVDSMIDDFLSDPSSTTAMTQASYGLEPEYKMPQHKIMLDNFIPAAVGAGLFKRGIFVCLEDIHHLDKPVKGRVLPNEIHWTFESFQNMVQSGNLRSERICLDIDLDYFNKSDEWYKATLWPEKEIRSHLEFLRDLPNVIITTIALSEPFSGGKGTASHLLSLVKGVWGITDEIEQAVDCQW